MGATFAFIRLQDIYNITATELAEGKIGRYGFLRHSKVQLTAEDCILIADRAHLRQRYVRMKQWLLEAERLRCDDTIPHRHGNVTKIKVYEYLAWSYYLESDAVNALKYVLSCYMCTLLFFHQSVLFMVIIDFSIRWFIVS